MSQSERESSSRRTLESEPENPRNARESVKERKLAAKLSRFAVIWALFRSPESRKGAEVSEFAVANGRSGANWALLKSH